MNDTVEVCSHQARSPDGSFASFIRAVVYRLARLRLERRLTRLLTIAQRHDEASVPRGDDRYQRLHTAAAEQLNAFGQRWNIPIDQLQAELPEVSQLESFSHEKSAVPVWRIVAVLILAAFTGACFGIGYLAFWLVTRAAH